METLDEKSLIEKYGLQLCCNKDCGDKDCEAEKYLKQLSNFVHGRFNLCNNNDGFGKSHCVLLRNINEAPYNYVMVYYRDCGPISERPFIPRKTCGLYRQKPRKILMVPEDRCGGCDDNFRKLLSTIIDEKESVELVEELELVCEAMDLNTEMKQFVAKETDDNVVNKIITNATTREYKYVEEISLCPKQNIESFGGVNYSLSEKDEDDWKLVTGIIKPKGWKNKHLI
jgi:hypothetical protein